MNASSENEPIQISVSDELDLHNFRPNEIKDLIREYLLECKSKGIMEGRIIHGKGTGTLREFVHSQLRRNSLVHSFELGQQNNGNWGSTYFFLRKTKETDQGA